ncbi:hypothetical protein EP331_12545 [bacterium]|nr:MAG: hypothetical protein EP331_12545 [bacterium]
MIPILGLAQENRRAYIPEKILLSNKPTQEEANRFVAFLFSDDSLFTLRKSVSTNPVIAEEITKTIRIDESISTGFYDSTWYATLMNLPEAHQIAPQDSSIVLAIIDTGIFFEHSNLTGAQWINGDELINGIDDDQDGFVDNVYGYDFVYDRGLTTLSGDWNGHGTAMASIAGARKTDLNSLVGIAPNVSIMAVRSFDPFGYSTSLEIARSIVYATIMGADVINMSFGDSFKSSLIESAIRFAYSKDVILVSSAGNVGGSKPRYPAAFPEVLAISWISEKFQIAPTGNYGTHVAFGAPGSSIPHAAWKWNGYTNEIAASSGSSASSAIVSGVVSWYKMMNPDLTNAELIHRIQRDALDIESEGYDWFSGAGLPRLITSNKDVNKNYSIQLSIKIIKSDSLEVDLEILGSGIKSWQLEIVNGTNPENSAETLLPEQSELMAGTITVPFNSSGYYDSGFTISVWADLWNGERVRKSVYKQAGFSTTPPVFQGLYYSIDNFGLNAVTVWESGDYGTLCQKILDKNNQVLDEVSSNRDGYVHLLAIKPETLNNAQSVQVIQNEWGEETIATFPIERKQVPVQIHQETIYETHLDDIDANQMWSLAVNDSLRWYVLLQRIYDSTYETIISLQPDTLSKNRIARLNGRFIPQVIYLDKLSQEPHYLGAYGGGNAFVFDIQNDFELIDVSVLGDFTYLGTITDTDNDGNIEIWAHNREKWAVFEFVNGIIQKQAEFENTTEANISLFNNEFQVPKLTVIDGLNGNKNVVFADYDGDLFLIKTMGDNQWEMQTYVGSFYGASNLITSVKTDSDEYVLSIRHSFPGLDEKQTQQPEFAILEWWKADADTLIKFADVLFTDVDLADIKLLNGLKNSFYVGLGSSVYQFFEENSKWNSQLLISERVLISPFEFEKGLGFYSVKDQTWKRVQKEQDITEKSGFKSEPVRFYSSEKQQEGIVTHTWGIDSIQVIYLGEVVKNATIYQPVSKINLPFLDSDTVAYQLRYWSNGESVQLAEKKLARNLVKPLIFNQIAENTYWVESSVPILESSIKTENVEGVSIRSVVKNDAFSFVLRTSESIVNLQGLEHSVSSVLSHDLVPFEYHQFNDDASKSGTLAYLKSADIRNKSTLEVLVFSSTDISQNLTFSLNPVGTVNSVQLISHSDAEYTFEIRVEDLNLINWNNELIVKVESGRELFSLAGSSISLVSQPEDSDSIEDALVFPSPWVMENSEYIHFSKIPYQAKIIILNTNGSPVIELEQVAFTGGIDWNGKDTFGKKIGSGVYFYQVILHDKRSGLKKIAVIK